MASVAEILSDPGFEPLSSDAKMIVREHLRRRAVADPAFDRLSPEAKGLVMTEIFPAGAPTLTGRMTRPPSFGTRLTEPFLGPGLGRQLWAPFEAAGELAATGAEAVGVKRPVAPPEALPEGTQPPPLFHPVNLIMAALPFAGPIRAASTAARILASELPFAGLVMGGEGTDVARAGQVFALPQTLPLAAGLRRGLRRVRPTAPSLESVEPVLMPPPIETGPASGVGGLPARIAMEGEVIPPLGEGGLSDPFGRPVQAGPPTVTERERLRALYRTRLGEPPRRAEPPPIPAVEPPSAPARAPAIELPPPPKPPRQRGPLEAGTVDLLDRGQLIRYIRSRGGLQPTRDYPGLPLAVLNRKGLPYDELAEEIGSAQGRDPREVETQLFRTLYQRQPPPVAPEPFFEQTQLGPQAMIHGTEGRAMPGSPLKPPPGQKPVAETPLFEGPVGTGQLELPEAAKAANIAPADWAQLNPGEKKRLTDFLQFSGVVPPLPVPSPPEEQRETIQGRLQQAGQVAGLALPFAGALFGRGRFRAPRGEPISPPLPSRPPAVLSQYRRESAGRYQPTESVVTGGAGNLAPSLTDAAPSVSPRPRWLRPVLHGWDPPDPEAVHGWKLAQRAESTMRWGGVVGEIQSRKLQALIPEPYHRAASEFLDTGEAQWLQGVPAAVRAGATAFRAFTERFKALALASGQLEEGRVLEHYFSHILDGPEHAVAEASRRFQTARKTSPFFQARTIPTLRAVEAWLAREGLAAQGVSVVRDPGRVASAYAQAYYRAQAMREMASDLGQARTREGTPVVTGMDETSLFPTPAGYVVFEHPLLRSAVGNKTPLLDARYEAGLNAILREPALPDRWMRKLDALNNLHRGIVMANPLRHGFFNVGLDALMLTGLWRGLVHGDWLRARNVGSRLLRELDPFVEKVIVKGGVRPALIANPLEEIRRSVSQMMRGTHIAGRPIPGMERLAGWWEQVERLTWEKMVTPWMIGVSKLLMDRMEAGVVPHSFRKAGITRELWQRMSEDQKFASVGRVVTLLSGQLPRTLFENPNFVRGLRYIMFSPSWNLSNLGMVEGALGREASFALRGLDAAERKIAIAFLQEYTARTLATHFIFSNLFQAGTTLGLTGTAWYLWQNPPGFRTRIYAGHDAEGRPRFAMSPIGYFAKDLENVGYALWRLGSRFDPEFAQEVLRSKLALAPKLAMEGLFGLRDPFEKRLARLGGRGASDRFETALEALANNFIPFSQMRRDPVAGAVAEAGISMRHGRTIPILLRTRRYQERALDAARREAARHGRLGEAQGFARQKRQMIEELNELIREYQRFEALSARPAAVGQ